MLQVNHSNKPFNTIKGVFKSISTTTTNDIISDEEVYVGSGEVHKVSIFSENLAGIIPNTPYEIVLVSERFSKLFNYFYFDTDGYWYSNGPIKLLSNSVIDELYLQLGFIFGLENMDLNTSIIMQHKKTVHGGPAGCGVPPPRSGIFFLSAQKSFTKDNLLSESGNYYFFPVLLAETNKLVYVRYKSFNISTIINFLDAATNKKMIGFNDQLRFDPELNILYTTEEVF